MTHKSHITSSEAKSRGWSRIPSPAIQRETKNLNKEVGIAYMSDYININATDSVDDCTLTCDNACGTTSATYTVSSGTYYPYQTWGDAWVGDGGGEVHKLGTMIKEREVTKMEQRTLFKVYVVDPRKNGKILLDGKLVIAVNENQAMLKAGVADIADKVGLELEQVDVYVQTIGTFIRPRKETQRVKITKEED